MQEPGIPEVRIVPANEASWDDLQAVLGPADYAHYCQCQRQSYRGLGVTYFLTRGAVEHARSRGARAIEGYPMITDPDTEITWGELNVGPLGAFLEAGFREVTHPSKRRMVVRIDF